MIAGLFRSNRPAVLVLVPVLALVLFGGALARPAPEPDAVMPLYGAVLHLARLTSWMPGLLGLLLVMGIAVQLAGLANDTEQLGRRNQLPALLFPLLLAAFDRYGPLEPALAGMPLVVLALRRVLSLGQAGGALRQVFDAGLLLGLAALFYLPYAFLVVVVWASVSVIRPFHWREYVVPLLGCVLVFYLTWAALHLQGVDPWRPLYTIAGTTAERPAANAQRVLLYVTVGLMALAALGIYAATYQRGVMRLKNLRASFMSFMAALGVIMLATRLLNGSFPPVLLAAPLAVFLAHPLLGDRRTWLTETACFALLTLALWAQWGA